MQYLAISDETASGLSVQVNRLMKLGWEPIGGVSHSMPRQGISGEGDLDELFCQAMIRQGREFPEPEFLTGESAQASVAERSLARLEGHF